MTKRILLLLALGFSTACGGVIDETANTDEKHDTGLACTDYVPEVWSLYPCGDDPQSTAPRTHRPEMSREADGGWSGRCACLTGASP